MILITAQQNTFSLSELLLYAEEYGINIIGISFLLPSCFFLASYKQWNKICIPTLYREISSERTGQICYTTYALRCLVFKVIVTIRWGNTLLSSVICHDDTQHIVTCNQNTQCTAGVRCNQMFMHYTHDEWFIKDTVTSSCLLSERLSDQWYNHFLNLFYCGCLMMCL